MVVVPTAVVLAVMVLHLLVSAVTVQAALTVCQRCRLDQ
jgi:hypothetical protein